MENKYGTIYCITNTTNNMKYIGATSRTMEKRWRQHVNDAENDRKNGCTTLKKAMQLAGIEHFTVETLLLCPLQQLDDYERKFIDVYGTLFPEGYNMKTGGVTGSSLLDEVKEKIGAAHQGKIVTSETRKLTSESSKYRNMSDENKEKLRTALINLHLEKLPMYIVLSVDRRYGRDVDCIHVRVPNRKPKKFSQKSMSIEEKIKLAIDYKNSLTTTVVGSSGLDELKV